MTWHISKSQIIALLVIQVILGLSILIFPYGYVFLSLLALGVLSFIILRPIDGYLVYIFSLGIPIGLLGKAGPATLSLRLPDVAFFGVLLGYLVYRTAKQSSSIEPTPFVNLVLALNAWMFISLLWVTNYTWTLASGFRRFYCLMIFLLTIFIIDSEKVLKKVYIAWIILGTFLAIFGLFQLIFVKSTLIELGADRVHWAPIRTAGFSHTSHVLAAMLSFSAFIIFAQLETIKKRILRFILFFSVCLIFLALLATFSKSILYGFVAGCIPFAFKYVKFRKYLVRIVGVALFLAVPIAGGIFLQALLLRHIYIFEYGLGETIPGRLKLWEAVGQSILDHPLLGVGLGMFRSVVPEYDPTSTTTPHNLYIFFLTEYGMIGLLLLLIIISYILSKTINIIKNTDNLYFQTFAMATSCGLITYLVAALALSYSLAEYIFWAFLGLHCVTLRYASKYLKTPIGHHG